MNPYNQQQQFPGEALPVTGELRSTFVLDQLTAMAKSTAPPHFIMQMATIFGLDTPPSAYYKLHEALLGGTLKPPKYLVFSAGVADAEYDNRDRTVRISAAKLEHCSLDHHSSWKLLAVLLHEFGHHLDNVLRQDLTEKNPDGSPSIATDAPAEEGSRFAYFMSVADQPPQPPQEIACLFASDGTQTRFSVNLRDAMNIIRLSQDGSGQTSPKIGGNTESFEAGGNQAKGTTHRSLSKALSLMNLRQSEVNAIYFGNWLRDHSQLIDPKIVRAANEPKTFFKKFSREALTSVVDILAARAFSEDRVVYPDAFKVTRERLGVYRPSQHIDNPKTENPTPKDLSKIDEDFEAWIEPGHPWLQVEYASAMKRYLFRSIGVMQEELGAAMEAGPSADGFRYFGAGLHILEDFYAHSNFVELNLIKLGYNDVRPWTSKTLCRWDLPLVTGRFSASDAIASLALPIAQLLAPIKNWTFTPTRRGERSQTELMLVVLLGELSDPTPLKALNALLQLRDDLADNPVFTFLQLQKWLVDIPLRALSIALGSLVQHLAKWFAGIVVVLQTLIDDPNTSGSTDPTHSQLSKDHHDHPFHDLAARLAEEAVKKVAMAMKNAWSGPLRPDSQGRYPLSENPVEVATALLVHPQDSTWQDEIVRQWAQDDPQQVARGISRAIGMSTLHLTELEAGKRELEGIEIPIDLFENSVRDYVNFYEKNEHFLSQNLLSDAEEISDFHS
ncbi:HET-C-related protein [Pseudomonas sp. NA-150]|uniref:HET-C-related protein n=1 Tax=Pseudomonas sp. NA-150 TaxID=3367525 RepID=UPI0037CA7D32